MLETCRVCRVTCDRYVYTLFVHDSNTLWYRVCTIAVNLCTKSLRIRLTEYFLNLVCIWIKLSLNECESIDTGDDLSSVLTKTVQDDTKWLFTNLVCLLSDTDRTLCSCE